MSDNARPVLYDADYSAVLASRASAAAPQLSRVVGKHCESGDIVVRDVYLPEDVAAGDLLAVPGTGAYCWALSSNYNYLARPAVVAVRDGAARLIVRGETEEDLLARGQPRHGSRRMTELRNPESGPAGLRQRRGPGCADSALRTPTRWPPAPVPGCELSGIAVRNVDAPRDVELPRELFTTDAETLVKDADLVIELMGGIEPARTLILQRHRATAPAWSPATRRCWRRTDRPCTRRPTRPACSCPTRPPWPAPSRILRPIRDSLSGDRITRVLGIVNGTTNFILDQMDSTGAQFADALAEAQRLGYAEADPTADVEGHDAAAKARDPGLAVLPHPRSRWRTSTARASRSVTRRRHRRRQGRRLRHQAAGHRREAARTPTAATASRVRVHPTLLPREHPLAAVHGAFNAVFIEAENAGELMFYGQGAGGTPTASAVLGDVVSRGPPHGRSAARGRTETTTRPRARRCRSTQATTSYYIGLDVADQPGVLARIAQLFAEHGVSIETMRQTIHRDADGSRRRSRAELRIVTHRAPEAALAATVEAVKGLDVINSVTSVLRVEGDLSGSPMARSHPRIRRPSAGHRAHRGHHAGRGRHPAGARPGALRADRLARCTSRSRA